MAADRQLAEIAGYTLRRLRTVRQICVRCDRRKIPDSSLCRRRDRARAADTGRRSERHRRDGPYRDLLLHRQGSDLGLVLRDAVWPEYPPAERLVPRGRWTEADRRVRQEVQHLQSADGQYRRANGWLVFEGDQGAGGFQRPQDADRRLG